MIAPPVVPTLPCKAPEYRTVGRFPEASCESRANAQPRMHPALATDLAAQVLLCDAG
jgi:hypothetical protein